MNKQEIEVLQNAQNELLAVKASAGYKTLEYVNQFVSESAPTIGTDDDGITTITLSGKDYDIVVEAHKECIERTVNIFRLKDATKTAQYFALVEVREREAYKDIDCKDIGEFASKMLGVQAKSAKEYLATIDTFFDVKEDGTVITPKSVLYRKASLTNLKQAKGFFNDNCAGSIETFEGYIKEGKLPINGTLNDLKKALKELTSDVDEIAKQEAGSEEQEAQEAQEAGSEAQETQEVDTPQRKARFYGGKFMQSLLECVTDESEKQFVLDNVERLLALIKEEC